MEEDALSSSGSARGPAPSGRSSPSAAELHHARETCLGVDYSSMSTEASMDFYCSQVTSISCIDLLLDSTDLEPLSPSGMYRVETVEEEDCSVATRDAENTTDSDDTILLSDVQLPVDQAQTRYMFQRPSDVVEAASALVTELTVEPPAEELCTAWMRRLLTFCMPCSIGVRARIDRLRRSIVGTRISASCCRRLGSAVFGLTMMVASPAPGGTRHRVCLHCRSRTAVQRSTSQAYG